MGGVDFNVLEHVDRGERRSREGKLEALRLELGKMLPVLIATFAHEFAHLCYCGARLLRGRKVGVTSRVWK
eukprot:769659-Rhodomonas_salina.1